MPAPWREPLPERRLVEVRCRDCRRLLYRVLAEQARIETVCPDKRCRRLSVKVLTPSSR